VLTATAKTIMVEDLKKAVATNDLIAYEMLEAVKWNLTTAVNNYLEIVEKSKNLD
jgi:hypothetical protein